MVEVIKEGRKTIQCDSCTSILGYTNNDIKYEETNYGRYDSYIKCPVCGAQVYIHIN